MSFVSRVVAGARQPAWATSMAMPVRRAACLTHRTWFLFRDNTF
ncbi:MAG: hypothetical protein OJF60_000908 [Burkholderiaceae bacterium]|nr:MAG: hypothetical protein OJF60_000908 [Burkholderiaceae bacterium]